MEIAQAAEHDAELCRAAFKTNSPATEAVLEQLLRVIENGHPDLQVCEVFCKFSFTFLLTGIHTCGIDLISQFACSMVINTSRV